MKSGVLEFVERWAPVPVAADVRLFIGAEEMGRVTAKLLAQVQLEGRPVLAALILPSLVTAAEKRKKRNVLLSFLCISFHNERWRCLQLFFAFQYLSFMEGLTWVFFELSLGAHGRLGFFLQMERLTDIKGCLLCSGVDMSHKCAVI